MINGIEPKVGQKWKQKNGTIVTVVHTEAHRLYPIWCVDMITSDNYYYDNLGEFCWAKNKYGASLRFCPDFELLELVEDVVSNEPHVTKLSDAVKEIHEQPLSHKMFEAQIRLMSDCYRLKSSLVQFHQDFKRDDYMRTIDKVDDLFDHITSIEFNDVLEKEHVDKRR
jgi:hypothetical protein